MDAFAIVGDPDGNRTQGFAQAARAAGADVVIVPYRDAIAGNPGWADSLAARRVRLESPGRDFEVERALLARGAAVGAELGFSQISAEAVPALQRDPGRVWATRQWYLGWNDFLREVERTAAGTGATFLNPPAEIAVMFDKSATHARLAAAGVPVPRALPGPPPRSCEELLAALDAAGWSRAFLKTSHGSAANGVVALAHGRGRLQAATAIELAGDDAGTRLYATRRLRTYSDLGSVRRLVDALCRERLHVEAWVPKAGLAGRTCDVRVVVIRSRACHLMLRLASGPITNLHLEAEKGTEALLAAHGGEEALRLVRETAERAAACFPASFAMGVDLAIAPSWRRAWVLEVNAFGDRLEGVEWRGADTYTWEMRAALNRDWPPPH